MRNPVIIIASSSSSSPIFTPNHRHNNQFPNFKPSLPVFKLHASPPQFSSTLSNSLLAATLIPSIDTDGDINSNSIGYYAEVASALVGEGRFQEFVAVAEGVDELGGNAAVDFGRLLKLGVLADGIRKGLGEGNVGGVIEVLNCVGRLRGDVSGVIDRVSMGVIGVEIRRIVGGGKLEEAVEFLELLSGFQLSVRNLVEPNDMIRRCVHRRKPHIAVRYASLLPHAEILYCTIIKEFGKKGDLVSALSVYEASKQKLTSHNMFVYRSIIDACGLCRDSFKSRFIYEDLLNQKVIPNIFVFNSVMNVNAYDLTFTMDVYKKMNWMLRQI